MATSMAGGGGGMRSAVFTLSQWHELEHQALILKYLLAGIPVPPDLLFPIQKSFQSLSSRFFPNTALGYCSFYGKKVDPEPGRCRRTDGKKWRCSKDAYGDSKYCERHMHRGRNRSRKPVEQQPPSQTTTTASATVASVTVTGSNNYNNISGGGGGGGGGGVLVGNFQNLPVNTFGSSQDLGTDLENIPYGIPHKDYRYPYGLKADVAEQSFYSEASGKSLQIDWPLNSSQVSFFPASKATDYPMLQNDYPQNSYSENEHGGNLIPFFEDLSKSKGTWPSDLENEISRGASSSLSSTQLSISIPMGSSDFSGTSPRPPTWPRVMILLAEDNAAESYVEMQHHRRVYVVEQRRGAYFVE